MITARIEFFPVRCQSSNIVLEKEKDTGWDEWESKKNRGITFPDMIVIPNHAHTYHRQPMTFLWKSSTITFTQNLFGNSHFQILATLSLACPQLARKKSKSTTLFPILCNRMKISDYILAGQLEENPNPNPNNLSESGTLRTVGNEVRFRILAGKSGD